MYIPPMHISSRKAKIGMQVLPSATQRGTLSWFRPCLRPMEAYRPASKFNRTIPTIDVASCCGVTAPLRSPEPVVVVTFIVVEPMTVLVVVPDAFDVVVVVVVGPSVVVVVVVVVVEARNDDDEVVAELLDEASRRFLSAPAPWKNSCRIFLASALRFLSRAASDIPFAAQSDTPSMSSAVAAPKFCSNHFAALCKTSK